jgi:hypothetical protein
MTEILDPEKLQTEIVSGILKIRAYPYLVEGWKVDMTQHDSGWWVCDGDATPRGSFGQTIWFWIAHPKRR